MINTEREILAVAESGNGVGDYDELEDADDDPLGCPSMWSSSNGGLLMLSGRPMIFFLIDLA